MKKEDVYRKTLLCFNVNYDKIMNGLKLPSEGTEGTDETDAGGTEHAELPNEVLLCEGFYRSAELFCVRSYDWSFLYKNVDYTGDDLIEEKSSYCSFAYKQPEDMAKPLFVNGVYNSTIRRVGSVLYFDIKNPRLTYISDRIDYENDTDYPDDFFYMIAYKLAMEIQPNIQPDNNTILNTISQKMLTVFQALRTSEMESDRIKNPPTSFFVV